MSDAPCTGNRETDKGRLFYVYVNHYDGDTLVKHRARLCRDCIVELLAPLIENADVLQDTRWVPIEERLSR